uniref:Uncharacterized protein n=1 Tax=Anopheles atroparvus TaxID=41427 RepID=A0A182JEQ8_ANOAO
GRSRRLFLLFLLLLLLLCVPLVSFFLSFSLVSFLPPPFSGSSIAECGKCRIGTKRLNLNKFCKRDYVIMAKVIGRETKTDNGNLKSPGNAPPYHQYQQAAPAHQAQRSRDRATVEDATVVKFRLSVQKVFKRSRNPASPLGSATKWAAVPFIVSARELDCRCPKIKVNRSYLILGRDAEGPPGALGVGPRSIVIEWRDEWHRRLRKFQRQASRTCD